MASCSFACSSSSLFISSPPSSGSANLIADRIEPIDQILDFPNAFHDVAAHVLVASRLGFLRQQADLDSGLRARLAFDFLIEARHDAQQGGFAGAVQTEDADLGARKEEGRYPEG